MKKGISLIIAVAMLGIPTAIALPEPGDLPVDTGPSKWIVGFFELPEDREQYAGDKVVAFDEELVYFVVETMNPLGLQAKAQLDDNVKYVETDVSDHQLFYTPNDYYWNHSSNWGVKKIGATTAWDKTRGSTSIKDGHIDSGRVGGHEDLPSSRFVGGYDYYNLDSTPNDTSGCSFHGTHTSGTVAATINNAKGFAGLAQITVNSFKIFGGGACYAASTSNIANAIRATRDNGDHISSNSWGGGSFSSTIDSAITYARGGGVIFIAAAGNGGCSNCVGQPWKPQAANVIIVTATDSNDAGASFNSKGPEVDFAAPGVSIGSANGPYTNSYRIMSGTSMATPHVAGTVALLKTLHTTWTQTDVHTRLKSCAVDLGTAGFDNTFGWGRINAACAVY